MDLYQQVIPSGSKSGKHRHRGEKIVIVLEGEGYNRHWDAELTVVDDGKRPEWRFDEKPKTFEREAGDAVYVLVNTIHQHHNTSEEEPARIISAQARTHTNLGFGYEDLEQFEAAPEYEE